MSSESVYDKNGVPIAIGDTIKIFHYIGARRKKHYMYKFVLGIKGDRFKLSHLSKNIEDYFTLKIDNRILSDFEVVQGFGEDGTDFTDRQKRNKH
jgi:hypothetical protein